MGGRHFSYSPVLRHGPALRHGLALRDGLALRHGPALRDGPALGHGPTIDRSLVVSMAAVLAVWIIAWLRWVMTDGVVPWDSKNQFYAFFRFLAESLHAGTTVFWNPYHYGGHPSIADPQSLIFSPPFLLWAWFDRTPSLRSFDLIVMLHLLAGGLAMTALGWRRHWPVPASVLTAAVFMLGGAASSRLNHTGIIVCYGMFPVALVLLEMALERRSFRFGTAFAIVASIILLGRNQVALMLSIGLAVAAAVAILRAPSPWEYLKPRRALLVAIAAIGFAMCAVPLLLTAQLADLSNRPSSEIGEAMRASLYPSNLITLAAANAFGSHVPGFNYWGPQHAVLPDVGSTDDSFNYLFVGAVPVMLLVWIGMAGCRLSRGGMAWVTAAAVFVLLFAIGRYAPVFSLVFDYVPGFNYFRRPVDATFLVTIAVALLSGRLLTDYVRVGMPKADPLVVAVVLAGGVVLVADALAVSDVTGHALQTAYSIAGAVLLLLAVGGVATAMSGTAELRARAAGLLALAGSVELIGWNAASRLNSEHRRYYEVLETATADDADALRQINAEIERRHGEGARPRIEIVGLDGPWQNLAAVHKLEVTNGYNPLRIGIYDRVVEPGEGNWIAGSRRFPATFNGYDCAVARALGLEYLVLDRPLEELKQLRQLPRVEILRAGPKVWIYRIRGAQPRVRFSSRIEVADVDARTLTGELINPPSPDHVVIDDETPPTSRWLASTGATGGGIARIASWRPGRIEVAVQANTAGLLVLHDIYYPGWVAELDGTSVPILRTDVMFRGVEIPAGQHTVVYSFDPLRIANLTAAAQSLLYPKKQPIASFELAPIAAQ